MKVICIAVITLPLTMVGVWCASISTVDVTNDKVELWQSDNDVRQEQRDQPLMERYLSVGRRRKKRNGDNTPSYKDALFTSPRTAYFQKNQTQYLRCPTWRLGETLSSVFWYRRPTLVAKFSAPNEPGKNFTAERYQLMDDQSGLIIYNVTDDDGGLYDCRVVPTATKRERQGLVNVEILDSTFPADADTMDSINIALLSQNVDRQNGGRIKCPHSTTDASATYWSLDKGEGVDTDIIGAEYSNKDTLVLDTYKEDYQIVNGGDLQILSLQRPHRRFWCHRFLNGLAVGRVDVTGVVSTNQDQPIITGCEPLPGDGCQVNFNPDKDLQLKCSILNVYPRVTLYWNDVSRCDINFNEESLESFDDDAKTFNQYQQLTVKAGRFSDDCLPKFVCNATGAAIPVQPFGAEVALQVVSGATWIIFILLFFFAVGLSSIIMLILVIRRRNFLRKIVRSPNVEANTVESDDSKCQSPTFTEKTEVEIELEDKGCYVATLQDERKTIKDETLQSEELKLVKNDESQTLMPQTSQIQELNLDDHEHVEIHPSGSSSFSPRRMLIQARNIVVNIHHHVGNKTPTKRNRRKPKLKKDGKGGASYQKIPVKAVTESSPSDQLNLEVEMHDNSLTSPQQLNMANSTLQEERGYEADESNPQDVSGIQETSDTLDNPPENVDQQTSPNEVTCEPQQKEELHHSVNEEQPGQQCVGETNSKLHLTEDEANPHGENLQKISIIEHEADPSDAFNGASSDASDNTASDNTSSQKQNDVIPDENQQSKAPEQSPAACGKIAPKRKKPHQNTPYQKFKSKNVQSENKDSLKPKGVANQAAGNSKHTAGRDTGNVPDQETGFRLTPDSGYSGSAHCGPDGNDDAVATEESSEEQSAKPQVTQPINTDQSAKPQVTQPINTDQSAKPQVTQPINTDQSAKPQVTQPINTDQSAKPQVTQPINTDQSAKPQVTQPINTDQSAKPQVTQPINTDQSAKPQVTQPINTDQSAKPQVTQPINTDQSAKPQVTQPINTDQSAKPQVTQPINTDQSAKPQVTQPINTDQSAKPQVTQPINTDQSAKPQVTQPALNSDFNTESSPTYPLLDPTVNPNSEDVQHPHNKDPTQQPEPIMKQPSPHHNPFPNVTPQEPPSDNSSQKEQDAPPLSLPYNAQIQTPKAGIPEPSLQADQDGHVRAQMPVVSPQSYYCEPSPDVCPESNGSRYPDRTPSDDEDMVSESGSGNEVADDTTHNGVSDDVGYDQQHETPSVEMDEVLADDVSQASPPDIEMKDSEDEVVERPKRDPKERQSKTKDLLRKQNPLITDNLVAQRPKISTKGGFC
ncbi:uncharacterized protein [Asterias amurensis]|uniref:uncharacterized protein isoform X2 n=1 Tax=Asterias amurensis TaxID=7602 RepID=UPI003AB862C5